MIVPIVIYGAPVFRQSTFDIHQEDLPDKITGNLFDTLKRAEGIGLAAPQIGLTKRIFVIPGASNQEQKPLALPVLEPCPIGPVRSPVGIMQNFK